MFFVGTRGSPFFVLRCSLNARIPSLRMERSGMWQSVILGVAGTGRVLSVRLYLVARNNDRVPSLRIACF